MRRKKTIWILGISCFLFNAVSVYFFINRREGDFVKHVTYEKLYAPDHNTGRHLKKWKKTSAQFDTLELAEAKKLTRLYAGVNDADSTIVKVMKIGSWLRKSFNHCEIGKPTPAFGELSSLEQYKSAVRKESPVWCGTYGSQLTFFCIANGIVARYVESKGGPDNHVVNESFIPETQQWIFSDLLNNCVLLKNKDGRLMNTVDLLNRNVKMDTSSLIAYGFDPGTTFDLPSRHESSQLWKGHLNLQNHLFFYYTTDLETVYHPLQKTIRYIYPKTWFELFTLQPVSNTSFYLRIFFLYAGITLSGILIYFILKRHD